MAWKAARGLLGYKCASTAPRLFRVILSVENRLHFRQSKSFLPFLEQNYEPSEVYGAASKGVIQKA